MSEGNQVWQAQTATITDPNEGTHIANHVEECSPFSRAFAICSLWNHYLTIVSKTLIFTVQMLRAVAKKWSIGSSDGWKLTGDPCTGPAVDETEISNPGIKCDCSFDNGSICHITQMKVYALDKTGELPEELANLTFLWDLVQNKFLMDQFVNLWDIHDRNLAQNYLTGSLPDFLGNLTGMQHL
eukprot:Gb_19703 [translate_table: standard]